MMRLGRTSVLACLALVACPASEGGGETDSATAPVSEATSGQTSDESQTSPGSGPTSEASGSGPSSDGTSTSSSDGTSTSDPTTDPSDGSGTDDSAEGSSGAQDLGACAFDEVDDFAAAGPFEVTVEPGGPACTIFRPTDLGAAGRLHPIVVWGNGTTLSPPIYDGVLRHWASHGFIVAAANTSNPGTGAEMIGCLDWVLAAGDGDDPVYGGNVDTAHIGASGHSQGGGGALMAGMDPRMTATAPLQPYTEQGFGGFDQFSIGNQNGPVFMMSGSEDTIAPPNPNQRRVFDGVNTSLFWGTLLGADHLLAATGNISGYRGPATAWFRYHLMCDESARSVFYDACTLCSDPGWTVQTTNWE